MNTEMIFKRIFDEASRSPGTGTRNSYRVGAILLKKNRFVCGGFNSLKTHPILHRYSPKWPFTHAESHAIINNGLRNCEGLTLAVGRIHKNGNFSMAKPCEICEALAKNVGIKKIFYTDWNGNLSKYTL